MTGRSDDMGKHLVRKHSRRGVFRLVGAGVLGAAAAAALPAAASADYAPFERRSRLWFVNVNGQNFNVIEPFHWMRPQ